MHVKLTFHHCCTNITSPYFSIILSFQELKIWTSQSGSCYHLPTSSFSAVDPPAWYTAMGPCTSPVSVCEWLLYPFSTGSKSYGHNRCRSWIRGLKPPKTWWSVHQALLSNHHNSKGPHRNTTHNRSGWSDSSSLAWTQLMNAMTPLHQRRRGKEKKVCERKILHSISKHNSCARLFSTVQKNRSVWEMRTTRVSNVLNFNW